MFSRVHSVARSAPARGRLGEPRRPCRATGAFPGWHSVIEATRFILLALHLTACAAAYTPGVLASIVDAKRAEVERMSKLPENRERHPSSSASYAVGRAIGWKREAPSCLPT